MNKKLLLIASAAIVSANIYSFSGVAVAATDTATVNVVQALTITNATTALNFGDIVSTLAAETVIIEPNGTNTSGSITPTGAPAAAAFTVTGEDLKSYAVTVPVSVTLTGPGSPASDMTVDTFTYDAGNGVGADGTAASAGGTLNVGATLNVNASQPSGTFTGLYNVTVDYN